jgi:hypothetical protein
VSWWCVKCDKHIRDCECPDMDERLETVRLNKWVIFVICEKCGKHIFRCKCEKRGRAIFTTDN